MWHWDSIDDARGCDVPDTERFDDAPPADRGGTCRRNASLDRRRQANPGASVRPLPAAGPTCLVACSI
jgi:hypothetical protein